MARGVNAVGWPLAAVAVAGGMVGLGVLLSAIVFEKILNPRRPSPAKA